MQYVIIAHDGTDEGAYDRRMSVRPQHLENIERVRQSGNVVCAGGILDDAGKLIGSALIMDFATRELLDDYLASEPYIAAGVWQDIKIEPVNVLIVNGEKVSK